MSTPMLKPIREEIEKLGGAIDSVKIGRHLKILWSYKEKKLMTVCSISPGDGRALKNSLALIRRSVRNT